MMGGGELHQQLKNLCVNTDWKYAVFWKLNHHPQRVLSWEDGYCNDSEKNDSSESNNTNDNLNDMWYAQDHLDLAIAKMSYRMYSIGEGTVGQVADTGKHQWICGQQLVNSLCSINEQFDGWKAQFSAGIRTIVVIAVGPYGVVQLGSLKTITEDLKLVNRIRETFIELQENEDPVSDLVQSTACNDQNRDLFTPTFPNKQMLINPETETNSSFKFPAGCELYEALNPAFYKQKNCFDWETVTTETVTVDQMIRDTSSTQRSASENLLEAVVASVCCSDSDGKRSTSFGQPVKPVKLQPTNSDFQSSGGSVCYSFEQSLHGFSSASVSRCSEQIDRPREPAKKKRAKPGESGRPRPRDRQLIQDRIKELRELVPNGSKCSIDSLLERTIKHTLFMQCITKHADKIDKCAEFKLGTHEQGSSWAMEVGNEPKVCPIIVENISPDGQMLVEMVCDEGVQFLEIVEVIRNMGLTILKGAIDAYGDKTWMCFVVEGENNRSIHRMDVLWSLVQVLELKTKS